MRASDSAHATRFAVLAAAFVMALSLCAMFALHAEAADTPNATGEEVYNNACRTCHSIKAGDNRLGPHLAGIVGRKSGAAEGYAYSGVLKDGAVTFDEATLDKFIANPDSVAAGNNMKPYTGIQDAAQRAAIIAHLKAAAAR